MFNVTTIVWIPREAERHWKNEVMKRGWRIVDWWEEPLGDGDMIRQQKSKGICKCKIKRVVQEQRR
jgi:hypothetical protein